MIKPYIIWIATRSHKGVPVALLLVVPSSIIFVLVAFGLFHGLGLKTSQGGYGWLYGFLASGAVVLGAISLSLGIIRGLYHRTTKVGRPSGIILSTLLPLDAAEERIVSLDAAFDCWSARYGEAKARRIYRIQSVGTVLGFWIEWLLQKSRLLELVEKWLTRPSG